MIDKQRIEGLASRESLQVGILIELLFEESIGELEEQRKAIKIYPKLATKRENKKILAYENFTKWVVALIHPYPGNSASLLDVLDYQINSQDFYSWLCKNQSSLPLTSIAKLFMDAFEKNQIKRNQPILDCPPYPDRKKSSHTRREANKQKTQKRYNDWGKAHRKLKWENPDKSDNWCAIQISRMPIGKGYNSETIRKNMKK